MYSPVAPTPGPNRDREDIELNDIDSDEGVGNRMGRPQHHKRHGAFTIGESIRYTVMAIAIIVGSVTILAYFYDHLISIRPERVVHVPIGIPGESAATSSSSSFSHSPDPISVVDGGSTSSFTTASYLRMPLSTPNNFHFDPIFQSDVNRFLSSHMSQVARWEDPVEWKRIRQQENKWTPLDDSIDRLTSSPIAYDTTEKRSRLPFNPSRFRELNIPILWSDTTAPKDPHDFAHVHWNPSAEKKAIELIRQQQFPQPPVDCTKAKYVIIEQWGAGFFSRFNNGIEQVSRALAASDRQILFGYTAMDWDKNAIIQKNSHDDYLNEGMLQYFQPFAQCQFHPYVQEKLRMSASGESGIKELTQSGAKLIWHWGQTQPGGEDFDTQFVHLCENVCPRHGTDASSMYFRRLLFDHRVYSEHDQEWRRTELPLAVERDDYSVEHIYPIDKDGLVPTDEQWTETKDYRSKMFKEFMEIMLSAFFFRPNFRIMMQRSLLSDYWRSQMLRKSGIYPTPAVLAPNQPDPLDNSAGIFVRRGDKCIDDDYCKAHNGQFRGFGLFIHSVYLEEQRRGKPFSSVFFMSDDGPALDALLKEIADANREESFQRASEEEIADAIQSNDDMRVARTILRGRWATHNVFSPASCFNPSAREGYESFLTNLQYLLHHNAFVVGHESSNVMYWLARMLFMKNQFDPSVTRTGPGAWSQDVRDDFKQIRV